jgi:hypothetical protein
VARISPAAHCGHPRVELSWDLVGGTAQAAPVSPHGLRITLTLPARPDPRSAPQLAASAS